MQATHRHTRCKLQPKLHCAGCMQTHVHMLTHNTCHLSSIHGWKSPQWMPWLCNTLTHLLVSICWVPQITLTLPQVHKWGHFLWSERLKTPAPPAMCCCPSFFFFHARALRFQPIRCKVCRTGQTVPRACWAKRFGPRTQLRHSSPNCPNQVHEGEVYPIKNELKFAKLFWGLPNTPN